MEQINKELVKYVENEIIPRYDYFDSAHQRNHVQEVIKRSLNLARYYDVDINMVYAIAAFHDTGLCEGREMHHVASGKIILSDDKLSQWFTQDQIEIMAQAAEDHRASSGHEPRSIYGKIVAEADRLIFPETVIKRTIQYGLSHYPEYGKEEQYQRFCEHMMEKYSDSGYVRLWLPESDNAEKLEGLRAMICDETKLRMAFDAEFDSIVSK